MSQLPSSITTIPSRWAASWSQPTAQPWLDIYTPTATYTDHAFQIIRQGRPFLERHFSLWRTANPDFVMTVDESRPIFWHEDPSGEVVRCSFKTINKGTWKNDLHVHKASGKAFVFIGVIEMVIERESGLVRELEEWYTNNGFDTMERGLEGYDVRRA